MQSSHASFAAQLAVSPPVVSTGGFITAFETWALGLAGTYIDTPEKRQAIVDDVMHVYDATGLAVGKSNAIAASLFPLLRGSVAGLLLAALGFLAPAPAPAPAPPPIPQGSAPPQ